MQRFDSRSLPEQKVEPPYVDAEYREIQDEESIRDAIGEVDELATSLGYLDRAISPDSHFRGWRGGEDKLFDAYRSLAIIRKDLIDLLEEDLH